MEKFLYNLIRLKKYFQGICLHREVPKAELLSSNEALRQFGTMWRDHAGDVMMMLEVVRYEFSKEYRYTEGEMTAVENVAGRVAKFFTACSKEWAEYERKQQKKSSEE